MSVSDKVLNDGAMVFIIFFAVASGFVSLGGVLFGIATIRARIFSRQLGISFIVLAAASFVPGFLSLPGVGVSKCRGGGRPPGPLAWSPIRLSWAGPASLCSRASAPRRLRAGDHGDVSQVGAYAAQGLARGIIWWKHSLLRCHSCVCLGSAGAA
jgi:hypothetical protein